MLSIKPISKAGSALKYYTDTDNYYLSDKETLLEMSRWLGKGAQKLGLFGAVHPEQFLPLLEGQLPNGELLGIVKNGVREHRTGTDITLSAPKSVSIMALVAGDRRLIEAHHRAVNAVKDKLEEMAAEARLTVGGETLFEKTANLVIAAFTHTSTRDLDPGLHDHLAILNMTERSDGWWRALSSRAKNDLKNISHGFREIVYDNQHYFGLVYSSTLAKEATGMGYDIRVRDKYGNFEIAGVPDELLKSFSKRRQDIIAQLEKEGYSSAKAAEKANLLSRKRKENIDSASLRERWLNESKEHNIDLAKLFAASKENAGKSGNVIETALPHVSLNDKEAVNDALSHLSRFQVQIKHGDLVRKAFEFSEGTYSHEAIEQEISSLLKENKLQGQASTYYTTQALQKKEQSFVDAMLQTKKKVLQSSAITPQ